MNLRNLCFFLFVILILMTTILKYFTFIETHPNEEPNVRLYFTSIPANYGTYYYEDIDYDSGYYLLLGEDEMDLIYGGIYEIIKKKYLIILFVNVICLFVMLFVPRSMYYITIDWVFLQISHIIEMVKRLCPSRRQKL